MFFSFIFFCKNTWRNSRVEIILTEIKGPISSNARNNQLKKELGGGGETPERESDCKRTKKEKKYSGEKERKRW